MDMDRDDPVCGCKTRARLSLHLKKSTRGLRGNAFWVIFAEEIYEKYLISIEESC